MKDNDTIKIGLMPPLSGVVGIYGNEISLAGKIACQEVNENGGVLGKKLELIIEDDGSLPKTAVIAAKKLVTQHKCVAIIGNLLSNSRISVAYEVSEPYKIPYLNFSFYEGSIMSRYFFHFAALPNQQIDKMIPYMQQKYGSKMYFAGNNYEWPRGSIHAAKLALNLAQGTVVGEEYFPINTEIEKLEKLISRLEKSGADVFVPYFAGNDQINLLTIFTKKKLKGKIAVVMGHYDEVMTSNLSAEVRDGFYSSNTYFMRIKTPENENYLKRLANMPGINGIFPNGNGVLTNFGEGAYLCVKAFAIAANKAGSLNSEDLIQALETVKLKGPQGFVQMDKETHHAKINTYLSKSEKDGTFSIIEKFEVTKPIIPQRYRHLKLQSQAALESEIRLQSRIFEHLTEGVSLMKLSNQNIVYTNQGFDNMFGYDYKEILDKNISIIYAADKYDSSVGIEKINKELNRYGVWKGEIHCVHKKGNPLVCSTTISTFTHAQYGELLMAVYQDITRQKQAEKELIKAKERAEESDRLKSAFLSNMSHEIRTPMNGILGFSELLKDPNLSGEEQKSYIKIIEESGARMLNIINDIIDISKIESGQMTLSLSKIDVNDNLEYIYTFFKPAVEKKRLKFILSNKLQSNETTIRTDKEKFLAILTNLVKNAIKYTKEGTIEFGCENKGKYLEGFVKDTGIGIPEDRQEAIFERFIQADIEDKMARQGAGLGLAISKSYVELLGGKIWVESKTGIGSSFYFTIPYVTETDNQSTFIQPATEGKVENQIKSLKILIAEDDETSEILITIDIKPFGKEILIARTGLEAVEICRNNPDIDLILMDIHMPEMNGYAVTRQIRQFNNAVIIIAQTAYGLSEDREKALESGCNDYISKPIKKEKLESVIQKHFNKSNVKLTENKSS